MELSPNDSSTQATEIQGDNVLTLSFTHYEHIDLDVDDYADFEGERYWLTEKYRPKQKSTKEWSYDIKLYGVESMIKRLLVIKTVDNEEEPMFTPDRPAPGTCGDDSPLHERRHGQHHRLEGRAG